MVIISHKEFLWFHAAKAENRISKISGKSGTTAPKFDFHQKLIRHQFTVGKKSIRALEIFRVQKLILNATS